VQNCRATHAHRVASLCKGFCSYGGTAFREVEAMSVGLIETPDETNISQSPHFIRFRVKEVDRLGVPVVAPAGGLGVHFDAGQFLKHVPQTESRSGELAAACFLICGVRGMERGTISSVREAPSGCFVRYPQVPISETHDSHSWDGFVIELRTTTRATHWYREISAQNGFVAWPMRRRLARL
jgi:hypothetical protein